MATTSRTPAETQSTGKPRANARDQPVFVRECWCGMGQLSGDDMFKQTIRFERAQDAHVFDQYLVDFLRACEEDDLDNQACVFTTSLQESESYIRVVQTDSASMLGQFLHFLTVRNFPPATRVATSGRAVNG